MIYPVTEDEAAALLEKLADEIIAKSGLNLGYAFILARAGVVGAEVRVVTSMRRSSLLAILSDAIEACPPEGASDA